MKDSAKYVGTPQSIAIRIPDCSVTTHLIDLVSGQGALITAGKWGLPFDCTGSRRGVSHQHPALLGCCRGQGQRDCSTQLTLLLGVGTSPLFTFFFLRAVRMIACSEWFLGSEESYTE